MSKIMEVILETLPFPTSSGVCFEIEKGKKSPLAAFWGQGSLEDSY